MTTTNRIVFEEVIGPKRVGDIFLGDADARAIIAACREVSDGK